jgi:oligopeptide transport system permease protein
VGRHLLRRLAIGVPTLLIVVTLSFYMMRLAPGGPFDQERPIPPEILRNIEEAYHLDEPLWQQYLRYLGGVVRGDFGPSYRTKDFTVTELLAEGAPASFKVGGLAVLLAGPAGLLAAAAALLLTPRLRAPVAGGALLLAGLVLGLAPAWAGQPALGQLLALTALALVARALVGEPEQRALDQLP